MSEEDELLNSGEELLDLGNIHFNTEGLEPPLMIEVLPQDETDQDEMTQYSDPSDIEIGEENIIEIHADDIEVVVHQIDPTSIDLIDDHAELPEDHDHDHHSDHDIDDIHHDHHHDEWDV